MDFSKLAIVPASADRWNDFERLFGPRGACAGCWCMYWRFTAKDFNANKGAGNQRAMRKIIARATSASPKNTSNTSDSRPPGLLGFVKDEPVAWVSIAPRREFPRLENSRVLALIDADQDDFDAGRLWSITCFFVKPEFRRRGISARMIKAAVDFARDHGAADVEAYPIAPKTDAVPDAFAWNGLVSAFVRAGFKEVLRRSETRPIVQQKVTRRKTHSAKRAKR
jgi:GNAT superfamily N-acetyltransferase